MISRRNIRIKVMQSLYANYTTEGLKKEEVLAAYDETVRYAYTLMYYQLFLLGKIAEHSQDDLLKRQKKLLPTDFDKQFTAKLYNNPITQRIIKNKKINEVAEKYGFKDILSEDFTKKLYKTFSLMPEYNEYVLNGSTPEDHQNIILLLYKDLCKQEFFNDTIEDYFFNWQDDQSIVIGTIKKIIKDFKDQSDISDDYGPSDESTHDFGRELLKYVLVNNESLEEILKPLIENWDLDRVATVDMTLIKMSVGEMLIFPTIPTKVSINEYVELTKTYSTDKSKDFVNGILDKVLHTLLEKNLISKSGRGLVE